MNKQIICFNGRFISAEGKGMISSLDPGFAYGFGLFETMRSYKGNIFKFKEHIKRLLRSAKLLGINAKFSSDKLERITEIALRKNKLSNAYIRINCWQGSKKTNILILVKKLPGYRKNIYKTGFKATIARYIQNERSILSGVKSLNYLNFYLARREAESRGFDEAILLNTKGFIAEGARSNIFLVKNEKLFTPSLECGCLPGITRGVVLGLARKAGIRADETKITREELRRANEIFLTNSLIEIMPVASIDGRRINKGVPGKLTNLFLERYRSLVKNGESGRRRSSAYAIR